MSRCLLFLGIVVVLCVGATGCGSPQSARTTWQGTPPADASPVTPAPSSRQANVMEDDFADPFVLRGAGAYYAFATGAEQWHLQVARSRDLTAWTHLGEALPELPSWALKGRGMTWAPSALARRNGYVLYYTTRDAASGFQCISRALSSCPEGPYYDDSSEPLICQVGSTAPFCGSIDPSPFLDSDGKPYLLWKSDENSGRCRTTPRIWAQALTDDGLKVVGPPEMLLAMDRPWEDTIIEAPSMLRHGGRYFLFYSGNRYDSGDYAIGYATCPSLFGLCSKVTLTAPYVTSMGSMLGPGGQELFQDESGDVWMAYHAWTAPRTDYGAGGARSLRLARMTFPPDGEPRLMISP